MQLTRTALSGIVLVALSSPTAAHHSTAIYDMAQRVTIEGTVSRVAWANPHVYIHVEQATGDGETIAWAIEGLPPAAMRRLGWTEQTLQQGDSVTVNGNPTRRTRNRGMYPATIEAGGRTLFEGSKTLPQLSNASMGATMKAASLAGTWETLANFDLYMRFYRPTLALTPAGSEAVNGYDEATMLPSQQCIPYSAPLLMIDPDFKQVVLADDVITINGGFAPAERTIHMNVTTHDGSQASTQGHSIGRWEGETLVIDTVNFAPLRNGNGYRGISSGPRKHLVERLTLNDDGTRLSYEFTLSDPDFLAEPVTGRAEWAYRADLDFVREPCDLVNAQLFNRE